MKVRIAIESEITAMETVIAVVRSGDKLLVAELERLGYRVEKWRVLGRTVLVIT